jgi:hypothetical protein
MKRVILNNDSSINSMLEGLQELIELNTPSTADFVDDIEYSEKTDYWNGSEFISIGNPPTPNHTFDYVIKEWVDLRTLDEIKAQKWAEIKQQRNAFEFGGFLFEGNRYDSDQISQGRIVAAASLGVEVEWTLQNNSAIWLSPAKLKELQIAMAMHVTQIHARGKVAREAIYAAITKEEIEAIAY